MKKLRHLAAVASLLAMSVLMAGCGEQYVVLDPKGMIGKQQLDLMLVTTGLACLIIVPVLIMAFVIVWRYRDRPGSKAKYKPQWSHNTKLEIVWWAIPILIIAIIGGITAKYTYLLEPSRPIESEAKPIVIQVTSLDWKWLFQYPDQNIATVNFVEFPEDVPVRFELTADAPMNSFWIPQLGGQIYTMSGMKMMLHLIADEPGDYKGLGANFSGKDFEKMKFTARATSKEKFEEWVKSIKSSSPALTKEGYEQLAKPGVSEPVSYSSIPNGLFDQIVNKYAGSAGGHHHGASGEESTSGSESKVRADEAASVSASPQHHHED
jgi:cytochrome o ubiquinol oxidase subunit II